MSSLPRTFQASPMSHSTLLGVFLFCFLCIIYGKVLKKQEKTQNILEFFSVLMLGKFALDHVSNCILKNKHVVWRASANVVEYLDLVNRSPGSRLPLSPAASDLHWCMSICRRLVCCLSQNALFFLQRRGDGRQWSAKCSWGVNKVERTDGDKWNMHWYSTIHCPLWHLQPDSFIDMKTLYLVFKTLSFCFCKSACVCVSLQAELNSDTVKMCTSMCVSGMERVENLLNISLVCALFSQLLEAVSPCNTLTELTVLDISWLHQVVIIATFLLITFV